MEALIVIDAQNEFSPEGQLPVHEHAAALAAITTEVERARAAGDPVVWILHENPQPHPRFRPGSWGAELSPELERLRREDDPVFTKQVFGAFTGTPLGERLAELGVDRIRLAGFLTHMCVSTTARESLMRGLAVTVAAAATSSTAIESPELGRIEAPEAHRSALLHLAHMGAEIDARR